MRKCRLLCILLSLLLLLPITGCNEEGEAYIYFELPAQPLTLDPQTASEDAELLIIKNIHEGLFRKNNLGEIVCGLAEGYTQDNLTYTFNLKKDIKWSNGEPITAHDFVFGFRRAVSAETKAPFASRLFCITGAENIYNGKANADTLGVKAVNDRTLTITLAYSDPNFAETLTTSVAMPCNEAFFNESAGKYGLFSDNIISSGSYRLSRWRKDPFGIRLYRNKEYQGGFIAQNAAVFLTCDKEETAIQKLEKNSVDMAFIDSALTNTATELKLKTAEFQNICWVLTLGDDFTQNMRKALSLLVGGEIYAKDLPTGYTVATSLFPEAISKTAVVTGMSVYDASKAKELYLQELEALPDKKFPSDVVFYYYDDGYIKNIVTDIVGHWQSNLSAFVNIEAVSGSNLLLPQLKEQTYKMALFPVRADNADVKEYLKKFGVNAITDNLTDLQVETLKSINIIPIMFQNTVIAYSPALSNVSTEYGNGYVDFSFIIKTE